MVAKLVVEEGDLKGLSFSLEERESWLIGRDPDECQFVVEDPLVSRKHLLVRSTPEGMVIENLSTTNPMQINDEEMTNQIQLLQNGDTLKIGNEIFRYYEDASAHILDEGDELETIDEEKEDIPYIVHPQIEHSQTVTSSLIEKEDSQNQDTIFDDEDEALATLAEINFGVIETGRWLLKVIGGPNNGAEFYMQADQSYTLGTDPKSCDIVFHDTSVSRQHAKITVTADDTLLIEDLKSRNGVIINEQKIEGKQPLHPSTIVTIGTTAFVVYDREGEMQTIISPLLPSIVKVLQQETIKTDTTSATSSTAPVATVPTSASGPETIESNITSIPSKPTRQLGPWIVLSAVIGLFSLAGLGVSSLFQTETMIVQPQENADELLQQALQPFPAIQYTFNKSNNGLLLIGHVTTPAEKSHLLYNLQGLKFIKSIDDSGIIIDEYVWREVNSILDENPAWKGITIHSPAAGQFILSGYLNTRKQAEQLSSYLSLNFPYLDLLKKQIVVEEDVLGQIQSWLQTYSLPNIDVKMANGEVTLTGNAPTDKVNEVKQLIDKVKQIPGVRSVVNLVRTQASDLGIINISEHYQVSGRSRIGDKYTVVINGRILTEGDILDGMEITKITSNNVLLKKEETQYRIDY